MYFRRGKADTEALGQFKLEPEYSLGWAVIDRVKRHKPLGIHLDQDLDFDI